MADIMALSPSTLPQSTHLVHVRLPPPERGDPVLRDVFVRLAGLRDEASWCAAILALLATSHDRRERAAWRIVAPAVPEREPGRYTLLTQPLVRRKWDAGRPSRRRRSS